MRSLSLLWTCLLLTVGMGAGLGLGALAQDAEACAEGACIAVQDGNATLYQDGNATRVVVGNETIVGEPAGNETGNGTGNATGNSTQEPPEDPRTVHECFQEVMLGFTNFTYAFAVDADAASIELFFEAHGQPGDLPGLGRDIEAQVTDGNGTIVVASAAYDPLREGFVFEQSGLGGLSAGDWTFRVEGEAVGDWQFQVTVEY